MVELDNDVIEFSLNTLEPVMSGQNDDSVDQNDDNADEIQCPNGNDSPDSSQSNEFNCDAYSNSSDNDYSVQTVKMKTLHTLLIIFKRVYMITVNLMYL